MLSVALLVFTPVQGEMTINGNSNLDTLDYDLDNIQLKLEKLESRWQLSPITGKLFVEKLRAKRLLITMRSDAKKTGDSALPAQIKLTFPIQIQQAEVLEVVVITPTERYTLSNVQFELDADNKTIQLIYLRAGTPFGQAEISLGMETANPFVLTGAVSIRQISKDSAFPYDVKTNLSGNLKALKFESDAMLVLQDNQVALKQTDIKSNAAARIHASGEIGLMNAYPLTALIKISDFHPERLGAYPAGLLNVELKVEGNLVIQPGLENGLNLSFAAKESYLEIDHVKQPVSSLGKMTLINSQIQSLDFSANIVSNVIKASGSLGAADSKLEWSADFPDLNTLGEQFSGEAHANGVFTGAFDNLAMRFNLAAQKLNLPNNINVEKLDGQAALQAGAQGAVDATFNAVGLEYAQNTVVDSIVSLKGTRTAHQLKMTAVAQDKTNPLQFETMLQGGLIEGSLSEAGSMSNQWQGMIQRFSLKGETPVTLEAPAKLNLTTKDISLGKAVLQLTKGRVVVDGLNAGSKGFVSKGSLVNLALDDIPPSVFKLPPKLQGNPVFSGTWDVNAVEAVNARMIFKLDSGDLTLSNAGGVPKPLGLQDVKAELQIVNNKADLVLLLQGQQLGHLDAHVTTTLTKVESGFALMANAPLTIASHAQLNTIAWLPLSDSLADANLDGALTMTLDANGTVQKPNLRGSMDGKNLQFILASQGVSLTDGMLQATFENDELRITQGAWKGGNGYLRTNGTLQMVNNHPKIELNWAAEQFTVISGADRLLILNGAGKTTLVEDLFSISGDFKVQKGLLELPDDDVPKLQDDVVVLGRSVASNESALKILLNNLRIDLGDDFTLHGRGLDAQLTGAVTLVGLTQYHPHAEGAIRFKKGTYMAYGQVLNITRGIISFSGPIDNPGLNVRAMRNAVSNSESLIKTNAETTTNTGEITGSNFSQTSASNSTQNVNAGVEITGNGLYPVIKLVSEPNVPDTEKLSWLMLGHGTEQAGKNDFAMLSLAAGVVLSQGDSMPLQTQLARAAGLDELSFSGSDAETASLTFGKRLSSQLYLSYEKSVSGLLDVARLTFNITPRWALQAETGSESAVDALYTFSFK